MSQGLVQKFLGEFIERYSYVRNYRNDFLLALGREARRAGMNDSDFEELVLMAVLELAMSGCDELEIRRNMVDAHRFAELNHLEKYSRWGQIGSIGSSAPYE